MTSSAPAVNTFASSRSSCGWPGCPAGDRAPALKELGSRLKPPRLLIDEVAARDLGRKTGRGFSPRVTAMDERQDHDNHG
jgi:hypothetical protein